MDVEMQAPEGANKRESDRIRSFLRAQIIFNNRMTTIECIVKNISSTGARVALNDTLAVPTEFEIFIPQRNRSHHARLVWRDKDSIGINFTDVPASAAVTQAAGLAQPETPALRGEAARIRDLEVQNGELKLRIRRLSQRLVDLGQDPDNAA
jgi:hypothetical protein